MSGIVPVPEPSSERRRRRSGKTVRSPKNANAPHLPQPDDISGPQQPFHHMSAPLPTAAPTNHANAALGYAETTLAAAAQGAGDLTGRLRGLNFMDLYLPLEGWKTPFFQNVKPGSLQMEYHDLPPAYHADAQKLRTQTIEALAGQDETGLTYDGVRFRISTATTTRREGWAALRRIEEKPPAIEQLGFMQPVAESLAALGIREGLVLITGATGQGKTTTATALLYNYLIRHGGVALTIEDPVEYLIDGRVGEAGMCYQLEVQKEEDWADHLRRALRWHPRYILVGELRTPEAANQLLRAANSGHLVITTMHAGSLEEGLEGLLHLAEQRIGEHAPILLAAGLAAAMHQTFSSHSISLRLYMTEEGNLGEPVRNLIRERKIGQMATFVDQQMAKRMQRDAALSEYTAEQAAPAVTE